MLRFSSQNPPRRGRTSPRRSTGSPTPKPLGARAMPRHNGSITGSRNSDAHERMSNDSLVQELAPSWPTNKQNHRSIAQKRSKDGPSQIEVNEPTKGTRDSLKPQIQQGPDVISPLQCKHVPSWMTVQQGPQSTPSPRSRHPSEEPEPLRLRPVRYDPSKEQSKHERALYPEEWLAGASSASGPSSEPRRAKSVSPIHMQNNIRKSHDDLAGLPPGSLDRRLPSHAEAIASIESPLFSPLSLYFGGPNFASEKKGSKTLIGDNGWLERTSSTHEGVKRSLPKRLGLLDGLKKMAKEVVSD